MYTYFFPEFKLEDFKDSKINKLKKQCFNIEKNEVHILTTDGVIIMPNDKEEYILKLNVCNHCIVDNYIFKKTVVCCEEKWTKESLKSQIPYCHKAITIKKLIFKPNQKSNTSFIIEKYNDNVKQVYILSNGYYTDNLVKNDVGYFLKMLM